MMLGLELMALALATGSGGTVNEWKIDCVDSAKLNDGKFDTCTITKKSGALSVEIVRTAEGVSTSVKQKGCKPPKKVAASTRTQEQLAEGEGEKILLGTIIENLAQNQMACRAPGGALVIPMTEDEGDRLLDATSGIRGL